MSFKSLLQIVIFLLIIVILGSVYYQYFSKDYVIVDEKINNKKNVNIETKESRSNNEKDKSKNDIAKINRRFLTNRILLFNKANE